METYTTDQVKTIIKFALIQFVSNNKLDSKLLEQMNDIGTNTMITVEYAKQLGIDLTNNDNPFNTKL